MVSSEEAYIKLVWQTGKPEHQRCSSLLLYYSILLFTPDIRLSSRHDIAENVHFEFDKYLK
jgi:hypothetical protein